MKKIDEIKKLIKKYCLAVSPEFWDYSDIQLGKIYNGCGPKWFPGFIRLILTWIFSKYEPVFLVHDFETSRNEKTKKHFEKLNGELYYNVIKTTGNRFIASMFFSFTYYLGWPAYMAAERPKPEASIL